MPRPEKVQAVADIAERIEAAQAVFLAEYSGLSVQQQQALRRGLRASEAEFKVVKMSLARRAAAALGLPELEELLSGPTAIAFADGDPVSAAKALKDFSADHEALLIKGGLMGADFLPPEKVSQLAEIEPRDVLLSKLAGAMKAPMSRTASLLAAMLRNTASVFQQLLEQKEAAAPPAAPAEPAPEAAAEQPEPDGADEPAPEAAAEQPEPDGADEPAPEAAAEQPEPDGADEPAPEAAAEAAEVGEPADDEESKPASVDAEAVPPESAPVDSDPETESTSADAEADVPDSAAAESDVEEG